MTGLVDEIGKIPMSPTLAQTLARAAGYAQAQAHIEVGLEHLLLALSEDDDALMVLLSSSVDLEALKVDVSGFLGRIEQRLPPGHPGTAHISRELSDVLFAASTAAAHGRRSDINGAIVLAAIVGHAESHAAALLRAHGLTFEAAIRVLQDRLRGQQPTEPAPAPRPAGPSPGAANADTILAEARSRVESRRVAANATVAAGPAAPIEAPPAAAQPEQDQGWPQFDEPQTGVPELPPPNDAVRPAEDMSSPVTAAAAAVAPENHVAKEPPTGPPPRRENELRDLTGGAGRGAPGAGEPETATRSLSVGHDEGSAATVYPPEPVLSRNPPDAAIAARPPAPQPLPRPAPPFAVPGGPQPVPGALRPPPGPPSGPAPVPPGAMPPGAGPGPHGPRPPIGAPPQPMRPDPGAQAGPQPRPAEELPSHSWAPPQPPNAPPPQVQRPYRAPPPLPPDAGVRPYPGLYAETAPNGGAEGSRAFPSGSARDAMPPPWSAPAAGPHGPANGAAAAAPGAQGHSGGPVPGPSHRQPLPPLEEVVGARRASDRREGAAFPVAGPVDGPSAARQGASAVPPAPGAPQAKRAPAVPAAAPARETTRSVPARRRGEAVEAGQLVENIPRAMRVGIASVVEVRIAKAEVKAIAEGLEGVGPTFRHDVLVTKAMSVRLRAPDGGFFIETASPETQWIDNALGLMADDYASWRWTVTPKQRGRKRLQLIIAARTVGADGLAAETALPDQVVEIKVRTNYAATVKMWLGWIAAAVLGGLLARFGETGWTMIEGFIRTIQSG